MLSGVVLVVFFVCCWKMKFYFFFGGNVVNTKMEINQQQQFVQLIRR